MVPRQSLAGGPMHVPWQLPSHAPAQAPDSTSVVQSPEHEPRQVDAHASAASSAVTQYSSVHGAASTAPLPPVSEEPPPPGETTPPAPPALVPPAPPAAGVAFGVQSSMPRIP